MIGSKLPGTEIGETLVVAGDLVGDGLTPRRLTFAYVFSGVNLWQVSGAINIYEDWKLTT